jgi:hypothetical protein
MIFKYIFYGFSGRIATFYQRKTNYSILSAIDYEKHTDFHHHENQASHDIH